MDLNDEIADGLRALLLAYERHHATWLQHAGLNSNERRALLFLAEGVTAAPGDLSRAIGMTTAGMTGLLDRLEAGGFLRRERHATDGRRVLITVTERGMQAHLELRALAKRIAHDTSMDPAAAAAIGRFLDRSRATLEGSSRTGSSPASWPDGAPPPVEAEPGTGPA